MPGKLTYFPLGGRSEPIRSLLYLAKFDYEDNRIVPTDWPNIQPSTPMGSLPLWEEDGIVMCQNNAILRTLGIRVGYYSEDPQICYNIDSLLDFFEDGIPLYVPYSFKGVAGFPTDDSDLEKWNNFWPKYTKVLEDRLAAHKKNFAAGTDSLTIADLKIWHCMILILEQPDNPTPQEQKDYARAEIAKCPNLTAYLDRLRQAMSAWMQARVPTPY